MSQLPTGLVFVYGTLRRAAGHAAHRFLAEHAEFVGNGFVQGRLHDAGEYPALRLDSGIGRVAGEVFHLFVPPAALARLDAFEGYNAENPSAGEFRRESADIVLNDGRTVRAWVYQYQKSVFGLPMIPSGDYAQFLRAKTAAPATV